MGQELTQVEVLLRGDPTEGWAGGHDRAARGLGVRGAAARGPEWGGGSAISPKGGGRWRGSLVCSLSPGVECLLNTQGPGKRAGGVGRCRAPAGGGLRWRPREAPAGLRAGVACLPCSGPQRLPKPSPSPPGLPAAMWAQRPAGAGAPGLLGPSQPGAGVPDGEENLQGRRAPWAGGPGLRLARPRH